MNPKEGWISYGRHVLHFQPLHYNRWGQSLEVTLGELIPGQAPLLKSRKQLTREQAIKVWSEKRQAGWRSCSPQWQPPPPLEAPPPPQRQTSGYR